MRSGQFRDTITVRTVARTPDGLGGWAESVAEVQAPAQVIPLRGEELLAAGKLESRITHKLRCRAGVAVTTGSAIVWQGRTLDVRGNPVRVDARGRYLEFTAEERS